jgi:hypothetical protein
MSHRGRDGWRVVEFETGFSGADAEQSEQQHTPAAEGGDEQEKEEEQQRTRHRFPQCACVIFLLSFHPFACCCAAFEWCS